MALVGVFVFVTVFLMIWLTALTVSIVKLYVSFEAMKQSTHRIQYVDPLSQEFTVGGEAALKAINKQFEEI